MAYQILEFGGIDISGNTRLMKGTIKDFLVKWTSAQEIQNRNLGWCVPKVFQILYYGVVGIGADGLAMLSQVLLVVTTH